MSSEHRKNIRLIEEAIGEQELPYGHSEDFEIRINLAIPRKWWNTPQHSNTWVQQRRADFEDALVELLFKILPPDQEEDGCKWDVMATHIRMFQAKPKDQTTTTPSHPRAQLIFKASVGSKVAHILDAYASDDHVFQLTWSPTGIQRQDEVELLWLTRPVVRTYYLKNFSTKAKPQHIITFLTKAGLNVVEAQSAARIRITGPHKCAQSHHWTIKLAESEPPEATKNILIEIGDTKIPLELTRQTRATPLRTASFVEPMDAQDNHHVRQEQTYASVLKQQPAAKQGAEPTACSGFSPPQDTNHQPTTGGEDSQESADGPTAPSGEQKLLKKRQASPIQAHDGKQPQNPQGSTTYDHNTQEIAIDDQPDLRTATNKTTTPASNEDPIGQNPTNTHITNIKRKISSVEDLSLPKKTKEGNSPQTSPHQI